MTREEERLRRKTDSGKLGDKVDFPDPATVPYSADSETGGQPTDDKAVAESIARQEAAAKSFRNTPTDSLAPEGAPAVSYDASGRPRTTRTRVVPVIAGLAIVVLVLLALWLTFPR